jgi:hypothetical protein
LRRRRHIFIRNLDDEGYLDTFFVSAIAAFLLVRLYLYATGFPKVGGNGLHIAHMLWGGLFMVLALTMMFNFLDRHSFTVAAVVGGAGFGLFIDELGKFITSNNDYFFQPATSIIYIVFVLMYLVFRVLQHESNVTDREYLINAIELFKDAVIHDFDRRHVVRARYYLSRIHRDVPMAHELRELLMSCPPPPPARMTWTQRLSDRLYRTYQDVSEERWFRRAVVASFLLQAVVTLGSATAATISVSGFTLARRAEFGAVMRDFDRSAPFWFGAIACLLIVVGIALMLRSRLRAYRLLQIAMLINILLTEVFLFYDIQFTALYGLAFNIIGLIIVNGLIAQERVRTRDRALEMQRSRENELASENSLPVPTTPSEQR